MAKLEISDEDYKHVVIFWRIFRIKNMKGYHHLYLKADVLLITTAFKVFGIVSINSFEFNPAHFLSTPSYSWDAMLRVMGVNLKLTSGIKKYQ